VMAVLLEDLLPTRSFSQIMIVGTRLSPKG
jgi:hypothetical protein